MAQLVRIWNWLLPAGAKEDPHALRKAGRLVAFALAMFVWVPVFVAVYLALAAPASAGILLLAGILLIANLLLFRFTNKTTLCGNVTTALAWWTYTALACVTGGHGAPATLWYATIPMLAITLSGVRAGICWSAASLMVIAGLYLAAEAGWSLPNEVAPAGLRFLQFAGLLGMLVCVLFLTLLFAHVEREAQRSLSAALADARAADRAKREFLANMSHEIRTPLAAILGFTELLMDPGRPAEEPLDTLRTIQRNGDHLLMIINDILDLSKIEAGKLVVEPAARDPRQIVLEILQLVQGRADDKGLQLTAESDGPLPNAILTDPTRLRQILINLVGNAVKFTERGSVNVILRATGCDGPAPRLEFEVRDTGIGIMPDQVNRLFEPFHQADNSTTRRFGGTGLGLAISRRLAESLGGGIAVTSRSGEGSSFRVWIAAPLAVIAPAAPVASDAHGEQAPVASPPDSMEPLLAGVRVLLAEDSPDLRRLVSHFLRGAGADVMLAENGLQACDLVCAAREAGTPFDIVLMDMQMPVRDGYAATQYLRQAGHDVPILALTANSMATDRQKCLDAGCDDYLAKPVQRASLIALLHSRLARESCRRS